MSEANGKIELWFFRDLTNDLRLKLFNLFGFETSLDTLGAQKTAINAILDRDSKRQAQALEHWRQEVGKLHSQVAAKDAEIAKLREIIQWCIDRDDRNGSLPESYAEKLRSFAGGSHV